MLLPAPPGQLVDELEALIIVCLEVFGVQRDADGIKSVLLYAMNVRLRHEVLTPVVEELLRMRRSQQIRKDQLNVCLRLGQTAEPPEIAFQHKPIADADPADLKRLAGTIHDLCSLRVHELRMGCRSCQQQQHATKDSQTSKKHLRFLLLPFHCKDCIQWSTSHASADLGEPGRLQQGTKFA